MVSLRLAQLERERAEALQILGAGHDDLLGALREVMDERCDALDNAEHLERIIDATARFGRSIS